ACPLLCLLVRRITPCRSLLPYTTLFRSAVAHRRRCGRRAYFRGVCFAGGNSQKPKAPNDRPNNCARSGRQLFEQTAGRSTDENRSEEHTSELQSRVDLVCRLLLAQ